MGEHSAAAVASPVAAEVYMSEFNGDYFSEFVDYLHALEKAVPAGCRLYYEVVEGRTDDTMDGDSFMVKPAVGIGPHNFYSNVDINVRFKVVTDEWVQERANRPDGWGQDLDAYFKRKPSYDELP